MNTRALTIITASLLSPALIVTSSSVSRALMRPSVSLVTPRYWPFSLWNTFLNPVKMAEDIASGKVDVDDLAALEIAVEEAPIVRLVTAIINQAVGDRAADIHIEPTERDVRVRFRVDGVLREQRFNHRGELCRFACG